MKSKEAIKRPGKAAIKALPSQPVSAPVQSSSGLPELLADGIKGMYWAENHLVVALPKMVKAAGNAELKKAFADHVAVTKTHAMRLEQVFGLLGEKIQAKKCDAVEGLAMDGEHIIENTLPGSEARDSGLIMAGLKTENYEITSYNGLIDLAAKLGNNDVAELLRQNLADEIEADGILTSLSRKDGTEKRVPAKKTR